MMSSLRSKVKVKWRGHPHLYASDPSGEFAKDPEFFKDRDYDGFFMWHDWQLTEKAGKHIWNVVMI